MMRPILLVLLSSLLQVLCFPLAGPLPTWRASLAWLAFAPLLWTLLPVRALRLRTAGLYGYSCGVLWYLGTCYWVYGTMHVYGGLPAPVALLALLLMCLYLALYHALFAVLLALVARQGRVAALVVSPLLWVAVELARARITSFPWNLLGYTQMDNALLTRLAPCTGVYGISLVVFAASAAFAGALVMPRQRAPARLALYAALLVAACQYLGHALRPTLRVGAEKAVLLQPNLNVGSGPALSAVALAASGASLTLQAAASDDVATRMVLWPESPSPFQTDRADFTAVVAKLATDLAAPVVAGAVGVEGTPGGPAAKTYNSAVLFLPVAGMATRYDKIHLVPFGEFVPYADLFRFASGLTQAVGTFDRGVQRLPLQAGQHGYGVFLCYESIFGDEVRRFVGNGAEVLVNLSDDGWYGDSSAPFQHINMARMRAIENRRWLLRDTNNGITASIDPDGRVVETMPRNRRGAVVVHFDFLHGFTFYTLHGDVFAYSCAAAALCSVVLAALRSSRQRQ